jgi:hypothetical protein
MLSKPSNRKGRREIERREGAKTLGTLAWNGVGMEEDTLKIDGRAYYFPWLIGRAYSTSIRV